MSTLRLAALMVRGGWRRELSLALVGVWLLIGLAGLLVPELPLWGCAAAAVALPPLLALVAARTSANQVRNPPTRNELPPSTASSVTSQPVDYATFRNPLAAAAHSRGVELPEQYRGLDVDSADGSADKLLAAGSSFRTVRAADLEATSDLGTATLASVPVESRHHEDLSSAVWLMPSARYHVHELGPLARSLRQRGISCSFVLTSPPGTGILNELGRWTSTYHVLTDPRLIDRLKPTCLISMSDWGPNAAYVDRARLNGILTIAKVEGAQDFENRDTLRRVRPYQHADVIMCQGPYDLRHVGDRGAVVGSCRIENLLALRAAGLVELPTPGTAVANYNFSYGTREYAAERWIKAVDKACTAAEVELAVSVHPAVSPPAELRACSFPLAYELEVTGAFITRSSTALFDALALGRPTVYFNPHRERAWKDLEFNRVVPEIRDPAALTAWLIDGERSTDGGRDWLLEHFLSVEHHRRSEERMADLVISAL